MSYFQDDKHVITCDALVLWDGLTQPDKNDDGSVSHNIRVAIPANSAEYGELNAIATAALNDGEFRGNLPPGGHWPLSECSVEKYGPLVQGMVEFGAKTKRGCPDVFDANGKEIPSMQLGRLFYPGAKVRVLVHAYTYNNKQKGIGFGLDGVQSIDATSPKLDVGGGLTKSQVAGAFGAPAPAAAPAPAPAAAPAPAPAAAPAPAPAAAPAPDPSILNPPAGKQLTAKANGVTYDQMIAAGWTDETLKAHGYL